MAIPRVASYPEASGHDDVHHPDVADVLFPREVEIAAVGRERFRAQASSHPLQVGNGRSEPPSAGTTQMFPVLSAKPMK